MTPRQDEIRLIPIDAIRIINPRSRNRKIFAELIESIARVGLKKPITVSVNECGTKFDLVCGQGRLEAFVELGQTEIPAVVLSKTEEDCYVMSLVENLARRHQSPLELIQEIGDLKRRGYNTAQIAKKTGFSEEYIYVLHYMMEHGEERILTGVERGIIPASVALEIVRAGDGEVQRALAEAYEKKALTGKQVMAIRRIIDDRNLRGRKVDQIPGRLTNRRAELTAERLIRLYRKETERQKVMVKRASIAQTRLVFVVNALKRLFEDSNFMTLLRAEAMTTLPAPLMERIQATSR